jgi:hypothetical protein
MNGTGNQLLACAGLSEDEYCGVCGCYLLDFKADISECRALANNFVKVMLRFDFFPKIDVFCVALVF